MAFDTNKHTFPKMDSGGERKLGSSEGDLVARFLYLMEEYVETDKDVFEDCICSMEVDIDAVNEELKSFDFERVQRMKAEVLYETYGDEIGSLCKRIEIHDSTISMLKVVRRRLQESDRGPVDSSSIEKTLDMIVSMKEYVDSGTREPGSRDTAL